jgi:hypothetical protein
MPSTGVSYSQACKEILSIDSSIRFVGAANKNGKIIFAEYRKDLAPLLTKEEAQVSIMRSSLRMAMRKDQEGKLGKNLYAVAAYEKVTRATIPLAGDDLLMVSFDNSERQYAGIIVDKIIPVLKKHRCNY